MPGKVKPLVSREEELGHSEPSLISDLVEDAEVNELSDTTKTAIPQTIEPQTSSPFAGSVTCERMADLKPSESSQSNSNQKLWLPPSFQSKPSRIAPKDMPTQGKIFTSMSEEPEVAASVSIPTSVKSEQPWPPPGIKWYYADASCCIAHSDCRDILPHLPKVDLVLTDPPYQISAAGGGIGGRRQYLTDIRGHIDEGFDLSILAPFPNWFCFCGKEQLPEMFKLVDGKRWMLITWNKPNPTPLCNNNYLPDTEYIFHCFEPGRLFGEFRDRSRYFVHPVEQNGFDHPTVKPLPVINKLINLGTQPGDLIVDPYCGSGTTLRAAKNLGRQCIGIEIEEKYAEIAARRLGQEMLPL